MLDRQLPQLTKRLQTTLDKLQNPELAGIGLTVPAEDWWQDVLVRHAGNSVTFAARGNMAVAIPVNLFDTVLENCLENIRKKQQREPDVLVVVELSIDATPTLTITDNGSPIPSAAFESLFRAPVANSRGSGLGIGLYQAFKQAGQSGYELAVAANVAGEVRFVLGKAYPA
jgi:K+-sensing histidine kinase KdpD